MKMTRTIGTLGLFGLGAGVMYLLDPDYGRARRAHLRDKCIHLSKVTKHTAERKYRDWSNRAGGLWMRTRRVFRPEHGLIDDILIARVRSELGHVVQHPHDVQVSAHEGRIILSGHVPVRELGRLLVAVHAVRGVMTVENRLQMKQKSERPPNWQPTKWLSILLGQSVTQ
jgi:hypothetical protein